jgi:hypothetical protein
MPENPAGSGVGAERQPDFDEHLTGECMNEKTTGNQNIG